VAELLAARLLVRVVGFMVLCTAVVGAGTADDGSLRYNTTWFDIRRDADGRAGGHDDGQQQRQQHFSFVLVLFCISLWRFEELASCVLIILAWCFGVKKSNGDSKTSLYRRLVCGYDTQVLVVCIQHQLAADRASMALSSSALEQSESHSRLWIRDFAKEQEEEGWRTWRSFHISHFLHGFDLSSCHILCTYNASTRTFLVYTSG
jgi:hypothetical protein